MTFYLSDHDWEMAAFQCSGTESRYIPYRITHGKMAGRWIGVDPEFEEEVTEPFVTLQECQSVVSEFEQKRAESAADPAGFEGGFAENH